METKLLKNEISKINMPIDMKERLKENCRKESQNNVYKFTARKKGFRKPVVVAASLVLCFCLAGVSVLAATGQLNGFFSDVTDWKGAVVGTTYENATNEIDMTATYGEGHIALSVSFLNDDQPPYSEIETVETGSYTITDLSGNIIYEGVSSDAAIIENGNAVITIPLENIQPGTYELTIYSFIGSKKADAPLPINGTWICEFSI
ncbi:MAG: hypothetical protein E7228_06930 [Clostridiales bacterium]|nr:hypothetical protein [Clostridiales bacterium]